MSVSDLSGVDGGDARLSDEEIALQVRRGDDGAFDELVRRHQNRVYSIAFRMLNDAGDAADAAQEAFVKAYRSLRSYRGESSFSTWLCAIAVNLARNRLRQVRSRGRRPAVSLDEAGPNGEEPLVERMPSPQATPGEEAEREDLRRLVRQSIAELPPDFSAAMVMRDVESMSYEDIAAALRCSLGTVKSRIARARAMVAQKLRRRWK